ncbi:ammonium transporter Rh type B [Diorhabda sublineata]|uniref:ammonium transporter Rh type B n=1 Tax=Diorhabda sublineata TaxID=1163346 RepID=UPI0024E07FA7|nr:ammonium transporter Rh type B [Diorhabda sublineata]
MSAKEVVVPLVSAQIVLLILFCAFGKYANNIYYLEKYPMFQDVHVMIFIGFGFLMTFLKRYGYSSVGFTLLLGSFIIQWAILCQGFFELNSDYKIEIGIESLYKADIAAASVLISMGVVLGKTSVQHLILMGFIEIIIYSANSHLGSSILQVADAGGSIFVHAFGAYFGLAVSYVLNRKKENKEGNSETAVSLQEANYTSDLFAMIGTVFLWLYWPSFNAIEVESEGRGRAVVNTYLALSSCTVTAFATSALLTPEKKFDMVHVQNSTLAGGVAVGAAANLMIQPLGAIIVGIIAGFISVFGYVRLTPIIEKSLGISDTCGVHNLHGMPGILSGLLSILMAAIATENMYLNDLHEIYPSRGMKAETVRSAGTQAGYQLLGLVVTLAVAIVTGLITGYILSFTKRIPAQLEYNDATHWELPKELSDVHEMKSSKHYDNPSFEMVREDGSTIIQARGN